MNKEEIVKEYLEVKAVRFGLTYTEFIKELLLKLEPRRPFVFVFVEETSSYPGEGYRNSINLKKILINELGTIYEIKYGAVQFDQDNIPNVFIVYVIEQQEQANKVLYNFEFMTKLLHENNYLE